VSAPADHPSTGLGLAIDDQTAIVGAWLLAIASVAAALAGVLGIIAWRR
jgi:hypothetical protein